MLATSFGPNGQYKCKDTYLCTAVTYLEFAPSWTRTGVPIAVSTTAVRNVFVLEEVGHLFRKEPLDWVHIYLLDVGFIHLIERTELVSGETV
jgi:hypothetical protein